MLNGTSASNRAGFSLAEMMIALVVASVLGASVTTFISRNSRFFNRESGEAQARSVSQGATNVLMADLRMVQDVGGVSYAAATGDTLQLRTPYAFGLICTTTSPTTVTLVPVDTAMTTNSAFGGYAFRGAASYTYVDKTTTSSPALSAGAAATCTGAPANLSTLSINGITGTITTITPGPVGQPIGTPIFLYQRVRYVLDTLNSSWRPYKSLRRQLMRGAVIVSEEELAGPFDVSSRFNYFRSVTGTPAEWQTSSATPPAVLDSIKGVELAFDAVVLNSQAGVTPRMTKTRNAIFFRNRRTN
jgi:prepilin-type N-terminal cleavage/methylation domain-containing protein